MTDNLTPRALGFRMPAEWERHEATWIAWPHNRLDWPGRFTPIPWVYAEIVRKLSAVERVRILVDSAEQEQRARGMLRKVGAVMPAVEFYRYPTDRVWIRDYGPLFVKGSSGEAAAVKWKFNAWAKYQDFDRDEAAGAAIPERLGMQTWRPDIVLEGGAIDVNGAGMALATEECLLSPIQARNPQLTREDLEHALAEFLGVERVLWLRNGIVGDDTHGHIDDLARFVNRETVVIATEDDPADPNYAILKENEAILARYPVRSVRLPMPEALTFCGQRLPASYANFYIANRMVLVPTFNDPNDRLALNILAELFEDREVMGIDCTSLVWGLGTLHCMTQQQPS
ncbi:MAG: Porphyromonas-type peptidyl-arginine deiminase [Bryobacterales bacterium]|nr:Porphyromonas-type peptidyl-arginine deiminase [Bryobacterales bacterium]